VIKRITEELEHHIKNNNKKITLNAHPFIAAFLVKGYPSIRTRWYFKHQRWVKIMPRDAYTYLEYKFKDKDGKELVMK
jgi:ribonuclease G